MRVPVPLSEAFGASFEELISQFATDKKLLPEPEAIRSNRFLARSVIPHVQKLSDLFNRTERLRELDPEEEERLAKVALKDTQKFGARYGRGFGRRPKPDPKKAAEGLDPYWSESSNPANLRLAYFLYFMPSNLFRVAAIWAELARLGYRWPAGRPMQGLELGAGPATGACGIAAGEKHAPVGVPDSGNWALIEQDKPMLELGASWAEKYFAFNDKPNWGIRTFRRRIDFSQGVLPPAAPQFNLWLQSYFMNESRETPEALAKILLASWKKHLSDEGLVIFSEPALKYQSRRILEFRRALLAEIEADPSHGIQVLLPCLGHQACGALAEAEDWCHEMVTWWRPPYFRLIDQMAGLDRKTLPFSYLVLIKSKRKLEEILPALGGGNRAKHQRLVSPAHSEGQDLEFFICGQEGKRRARYRPDPSLEGAEDLNRGDLLLDPEIRGDSHASRVTSIRKIR